MVLCFSGAPSVGADGRASQRGDGAETQPGRGPQRQGATTGGKAAAPSAHHLYIGSSQLKQSSF